MRVLITGGSRGIGKAIANYFAKEYGKNAQIALLGRSLSKPSHESLQGTLLETAKEVESYGAAAIPLQVDMSDGESFKEIVKSVVHALDGLDILINNAAMMWPSPVASPKKIDLLTAINVRGTLLTIQETKQALSKSKGSIITISPPVRLARLEWISNHPAYTVTKYSQTMATLAAASSNVRANCLWPARTVATAATSELEKKGILPDAFTEGRDPMLFAKAVHILATQKKINAMSLLDEDILDMPSTNAPLDVFVDANHHKTHSNE